MSNSATVNLLKACAPTAWRQRIITVAAIGTPENITTVSVSALGQEAGVAKATTSVAHGFLAGDRVTIAGATPTTYNGTFTILSVPSTTTFTYAVDAGILATASGTLTAKGLLEYRKVLFIGVKAARTNNTSIAYLGLTATNDTQAIPIAIGGERTLEVQPGTKAYLSDLWLDVLTIGDGVLMFWH